MAGLELLTFGCRLNIYESEVMRRLAGAAGLADAIIVNTCAVTGEAERQARQAIRRAHRRRPDVPIIVTGCAAQLHPDRFAAMPEVARVLGNGEKLTAAGWASDAAPLLVGDVQDLTETASHLIDGFDGHARAFLQVQQGCDHRCTFCIIPLARGPNRSTPVGEIVAQARRLGEGGYRELVLTGVDLTAYGADLPGKPSLGQMVRRLLALVPDLPRLRLSSLDPVEIDEELWRLIAEEPRLMPHLHLSVQAGDDLILKRMKRRHSRKDAIEFCAELRRLRPDIAFGADIIAGFPTETEAMFERSLDLVEECGLTFLHVFPYSPRPGTPAARMPQVAGQVIKERARRLRVAGETALLKRLVSEVGAVREVLIESGTQGRTEHFLPVAISGETPGVVRRLVITGHDGARLTA